MAQFPMVALITGCVLISMIFARPELGADGPSKFPAIPPELEAILPGETVAQLKAVHADQTLNYQQKQEQIDKIMVNLPVEILDRIPTPPGFEKLPLEVQTQIKKINRNKKKTWAAKQLDLQQYVQSLPVVQKNLLMGPMQG